MDHIQVIEIHSQWLFQYDKYNSFIYFQSKFVLFFIIDVSSAMVSETEKDKHEVSKTRMNTGITNIYYFFVIYHGQTGCLFVWCWVAADSHRYSYKQRFIPNL